MLSNIPYWRLRDAHETIEKYGAEVASEIMGIAIETVKRYDRHFRSVYQVDGEPKILLLDIETAPLLAHVWSIWNEPRDYKFVESNWYCLSWVAKWLDKDGIICRALPDYDKYKEDTEDDSDLLSEMWDLLDEADIIIAHNLDKFDERKLNARFIINGFRPPSPYAKVDTLKEARRRFFFTSNRLDALGRILGLGNKADTGGFELWRQCMLGNPEYWEKMKEYNIGDVVLLEKIYKELRPYMASHPNMGLFNKGRMVCSKCSSEDIELTDKTVKKGVSEFELYNCNSCGAWTRGRMNLLTSEERETLLTRV